MTDYQPPHLDEEQESEAAEAPKPDPLRSVYTSSFGEILKQTGVSLVVSTYQAGKVILIRYDPDTETVNTHFRAFAKPMGIAVDANRLSIGGTNTVWYYRNMPAVARKLEPEGKHDAAYLPRRIHVALVAQPRRQLHLLLLAQHGHAIHALDVLIQTAGCGNGKGQGL